jgi:hypothetical protein
VGAAQWGLAGPLLQFPPFLSTHSPAVVHSSLVPRSFGRGDRKYVLLLVLLEMCSVGEIDTKPSPLNAIALRVADTPPLLAGRIDVWTDACCVQFQARTT